MITGVDFSNLEFLPGCSAGLNEKTVLLEVRWRGELRPQTDWGARWAKHLAELRLSEPLWGFSAARFPADFVVQDSQRNPATLTIWLVGLCIALQRWARQPVWKGAILSATANSARLALPYAREELVLGALQHAAQLLMVWSHGAGLNARAKKIRESLDDWLQAVQHDGWAPRALKIFASARSSGIPTTVRPSMLQLGQGHHAEFVDSCFTACSSGLTFFARNKQPTSEVLRRAGVPVPPQWMVASQDAADNAALWLGWPVVVKPMRPSRALGESSDIGDSTTLRNAFDLADSYSPGQVIVQKQIDGHDCRLQVVGMELRQATQHMPSGQVRDLTARVHADNRLLAVWAAVSVGLRTACVDFVCPDISRSWREVGGAVREIGVEHGSPMRWTTESAGGSHADAVTWRYKNKSSRIATAVVAAVNGQTMVARLLHHMWRRAGKAAGVCTSQGVWLGDEMVDSQTLSGFARARLLLDSPVLEAAVIDMPCADLRAFGHPCDGYDVVALIGTQNDQLGTAPDAQALTADPRAELMARARVAVVVNADDASCLAMRRHAQSGVRHILVAVDGNSQALRAHREAGGHAIYVAQVDDEAWVVYADGHAPTPLMRLTHMAASLHGLPLSETGALFAMAMAGAQGLPWHTVCQAMASLQKK